MTSFLLPDMKILSDDLSLLLPDCWDGVSQDSLLASLWSDFDPKKHEVHESLFDAVTVNGNTQRLWTGMTSTFPEWGLVPDDYWSFENIDSYEQVVYTLRLAKHFGNIIENGIYGQLNVVSNTIRKLNKFLPEDVLPFDSQFLDFDLIEKGLKFSKFLKLNGVYTSLNNTYIYLLHTSEEEALKFLAKNLAFDDYLKYCSLGLKTYSEIYADNGKLSISREWIDEMIFDNEEQEKLNE